MLESSARGSLRTTLAMLRRELGEAADCVMAGRDRAGLVDGPGVWVDLREADRLLAEGRADAALARAPASSPRPRLPVRPRPSR